MANTNSPFGFRVVGRMDGGSPTAGFGPPNYTIANGNSNAIFTGDPVIPLNTGYIDIATASTVQIAGIFLGCEYFATAIGRKVWSPYWPGSGATGDIQAYVSSDPQLLFVAQSDGSPIVFGDINANIQLQAGSGNTITGISGFSLHQATITTADTLPFRIVGLWSQWKPPGSTGTDDTSNYNWAVVAPNNWSRKQLTSVG